MKASTSPKPAEAPAAPKPPTPKPAAPEPPPPSQSKDSAEVGPAEERGSNGPSGLLSGLAENYGSTEDESPGQAGNAGNAGLGGLGEALGKLTPEEARERSALTMLDRYFDVYDNPGGGDTDGIVSQQDLERVASGDFDQDKARERLEVAGVPEMWIDKSLGGVQGSASYLLENPELLAELDLANDAGGELDGKISRGDLSREILERDQQGSFMPSLPAPNRDTFDQVEASNAERGAEQIAAQEAAVLESLAGDGQPVSFTNSNGQTEDLSVRQVTDTGGEMSFELTAADGHTISIDSQLRADETRAALGRIADYYTQLPEHLREAVDEIELHHDFEEEAAADHLDGRIRFFDGLNNLNEEVFNHEYGHAVGRLLDDGAPDGWDGAIEADSQRVSEYAAENRKEDFADSFAAYLEALENGPEALQRFQQHYPERSALLEEIVA